MEIFIAVLAYLLHCFTAFALIYSCDKAKIWGDGEEPKLRMPSLSDLEEKELLVFDKNDSDEEWEYKQRANEIIHRNNNQQRQEYIEKVISPAHHYFLLKSEIQWYQSDCDEGFFRGFFLQLFSLMLITQMLFKGEIIDSWLLALLFSFVICFVGCSAIGLVYKKYWRCQGLRIKDFDYKRYKDCSNNSLIHNHYEYLKSIKRTVYFRESVRKILFNASFIIYVLFFFTIPEY